MVTLGRVRGVFGVRGQLRVESFTDPADNLFEFPDWQLLTPRGVEHWRPVAARPHGPGFVVELETVDGGALTDRDAAARLVGAEIQVSRDELPELDDGQVYWIDLEGCEVVGRGGARLGTVERVLDAPAHPLLDVRGERRYLIPLVRGPVVTEIALAARRIEADWDPDDAL